MAMNETIREPGVTVPEGIETVYENGAVTITQAALTDAARRGSAVVENLAIQKGMTLLETYRVESDAIEGGMGSVWRVRHTGWNVDLAMKRPQPQCFSTEKSKADFIRECEAWINLGLHPNIVSCYYVREIGGTPTIFSEWMNGGSLENAVKSGALYQGTQSQQQERILDIAIQFARGLHYAHEAGLIHQDVKPDNLLLTKEGDAKVADFGLARARAVLTVREGAATVQNAVDSGKTILSPSGGYTPAYCSMEQMDGRELTRRTDIYSWAVSVMELYLGSCPWANGIVAGLKCRDYFKLGRVPAPTEMQTLLISCMASDPEDRPHDFAGIVIKLHEIYRAETGMDYPRPEPKAAADTADSLNNRALSYLDLGKPADAGAFFEQALIKDAGNPECLYNSALFRWTHGSIDDLFALRMLNVINDEKKRDAYITQLKGIIETNATPISSIEVDYGSLLNTVHDASGTKVYYVIAKEGENKKYQYSLRQLVDGGGRTLIRSEHGEPQRITMSLDGKWICMTYREEILLYCAESRKEIEIKRDSETMSACAARDGNGCYLGRKDGLYYYDITSEKSVKLYAFSAGCRNVTQSRDGRLLAWRSETEKQWSVSAFDMDTKGLLFSAESKAEPYFLEFSYENKHLCVGHANGDFLVYEVATGRNVLHVSTGQEFKSMCAFAGGRYVLTGHTGSIRIWDVQRHMCRGTYCIPDRDSVYIYPIYSDDKAPRIGAITRSCAQYVFDLPNEKWSPSWQISAVTSAVEQLSRDGRFLSAILAAELAYQKADYQASLAKLKEARSIFGYSSDTRCLNLYEKLAGQFRLSGEPKLVLLQRLPKMVGASLSNDGRYILCKQEATVYSTQNGECLISNSVLSKYKSIALIRGDKLACIYLAGEKYDLMADIYQLPGGERIKSGVIVKGTGPSDVVPSIYAWPDCQYFMVYFPGFWAVRNVVVDGVTCKAVGNFQYLWAFNNTIEQIPGNGYAVGPHEIRNIKNKKRIVKFERIRNIDRSVSRRFRYVMTADPKAMLIGAVTEHFGLYNIKPEKQKQLDSYDDCLFLYSSKTGEFLRMVKLPKGEITVHHGGYLTCTGEGDVQLFRIADYLDSDTPEPLRLPVLVEERESCFSADMLHMAVTKPRYKSSFAWETEVFLLDWELL